MTLPGETLATGAPQTCPDCGMTVALRVLKTSRWYVGSVCHCGPYTRESGYYRTFEDAERALFHEDYER